jgi:Nif-specific regulatory protein
MPGVVGPRSFPYKAGMDPGVARPEDATAVRRERDLYRRLLELAHETASQRFLEEALALLVEATGANQGYLELYDDPEHTENPRWWHAHGLSTEHIQGIRRTISRGIIADAVGSGRTIITPDALLDERWQGRASIRRGAVRAVVCAPIGDDPPRGVVYLTADPDHPFSEDERRCVELVTRHLAPLADRLVLHQGLADHRDATRTWRERLNLNGLIGRSAAMADVLREVAIAAPSSKTVLLTGETGTGKSQIARVIHDNGPRARRPFIEVNCNSLPHDLAEAELFGYQRGAFTGAVRDHVGLVGQAEGGTLFLDEIGDLPRAIQGKLLQVLHSKRFRPLSLERGEVPTADIRIIAGTNIDLDRAVIERTFRQDLLYRLSVITIRMPSLAERRDDIAELAATFCAETCRTEGHPARTLSGNAIRALETAEWPGNVRQLQNVVASGVLHAAEEGALQVERRHVFREPGRTRTDDAPVVTYQEATRQFQKEFLERTLAGCEGNVSEAARRMDVSRTYLHALLKGFGIGARR